MKTINFFITGLLVFHLCGYAGEKRALIDANSKYTANTDWNAIHAFSQITTSQNVSYSLHLQSRQLIEEGRYQACVDLLKDKEEVNNIAYLSLCLGFSYMEVGNSQQADSLIHKAANIFESIGDNAILNKSAYVYFCFAEKIRKTIGAFDKSNYKDFLKIRFIQD